MRGTRRRKHVEAVLVGDRLRVSFPRWMSLAEADQVADELAERMRRRVDPSHIDVAARARRLAREYGLPRPRVGALVGPAAVALGIVHARGPDDPRLVTARRVPRVGARLRARPRARAPGRRRTTAPRTTSSSTGIPFAERGTRLPRSPRTSIPTPTSGRRRGRVRACCRRTTSGPDRPSTA